MPARVHSLELSFAVTFEKLQGATLSRIFLVLGDLSLSRLGCMTAPNAYDGTTRVRKGYHLAVFPLDRVELEHLSALRVDEKLRLWDANYNEHGAWKGGPLVPVDMEIIPAGVLSASKDALSTFTLQRLREIAAKVGVFDRNLSKLELVDKLHPFWVERLLQRSYH